MSKNTEALEALEQFIKEREAADKIRKQAKISQEQSIISDWTLTQLHIVATIQEKGRANNTTLSESLNVSKPAITKAVRKLLEHHILEKIQEEENKKEVYYLLTKSGEMLALIHAQLHEQARENYLRIFDEFNTAELETIIRFLHAITESIKSQ
ncbi:MarR family transcriptional regulator [Oceanobacillus neutriphilus]|uniref:MarR family transcriptional regulator n=1 Tax=Oceanobacillus neutriphilus TaxID=531815 RepID=A0ABQ2NQD7_9BACI|nr:MarR family transcriptional regulator [Oceanobacillus neutriphilus]GGP08623.1 MarR family transcriptional regulator [Oceanobacillus neutriphilus]